jgi:hypothetical protein
MFQPKKCSIPTVYCGNKKVIPKKSKTDTSNTHYVRNGTAYECMKKGYGSGMNSERLKKLPSNSLQRIKYVGDTFESNFKKKNIHTTGMLITFSKTLSRNGLKNFLEGVFSKKGGTVDRRAYNSTLMFLYNNGVYENLPTCTVINDA